MSNVLMFLWEYRFIIVLVLAVGLYAAFEWKSFKEKAYGAMLMAKKMAKDAVLKSGAQQEEWVVKKLYQFLPKTWLIFLSEERLHQIVHYLYEKAKDYLDDGKINGSIGE